VPAAARLLLLILRHPLHKELDSSIVAMQNLLLRRHHLYLLQLRRLHLIEKQKLRFHLHHQHRHLQQLHEPKILLQAQD
jgi:hypothetical protein